MITPNELTRPMINFVSRALKIGKQEVVRVLRIDKVKGLFIFLINFDTDFYF